MKDDGIDRILKRIAESPNFLQTNTDMIREVVGNALARAHDATCPYSHKEYGVRCQLPIGHKTPHQIVIQWESEDHSETVWPEE